MESYSQYIYLPECVHYESKTSEKTSSARVFGPDTVVPSAGCGRGLMKTIKRLPKKPSNYLQQLHDIEINSAPAHSPPNELGISEAGHLFLQTNKTKSGVVCLPSGLQYRVLKSGAPTAKSPLRTSEVDVHYRGKLIPSDGGSEFDSSLKRGKPCTFAPNKVVQGWTIALQLMGQGDKWALYVPPHLAYGDAGRSDEVRGQYIPAGAVLCFEIELLTVRGPSKPRPVRPPESVVERLSETIEPSSEATHLSATAFDGARADYIFTTGEHGTGYYRDWMAASKPERAGLCATPGAAMQMATGGIVHAADPAPPVLSDLTNLRGGSSELESSGLFGRAPSDNKRQMQSAKDTGMAAPEQATKEVVRPRPSAATPATPLLPQHPPQGLVDRAEALTSVAPDDSGVVTGRSTKSTARRRSAAAPEVQVLREQLAEQVWLTKATVGALESLLLRLRLPTLKHALNDLSLPSDGKKDELAARIIDAMSELTPRDPNTQVEWRGLR